MAFSTIGCNVIFQHIVLYHIWRNIYDILQNITITALLNIEITLYMFDFPFHWYPIHPLTETSFKKNQINFQSFQLLFIFINRYKST